MKITRALKALLAVALAHPAAAFESGGVSIEPAAGYSAELADEGFDVAIGIRGPADGAPRATGLLLDHVCGLGFTAWAAGSDVLTWTQDQHNAMTVAPDTKATFRQNYAPGTIFSEDEPTVDGVTWYELTLSMEANPGTRVFLSESTTPDGIYSMICSAFDDEFDAALPAFRQMRDTIRGLR